MGDGWGENAYLDRQPFFRDYPRLLIYETGVHFIDTFRYLLGEVTEVFANLRRLNPVIQGRGDRPGVLPLRRRRHRDLGRQPLQRGRVALAAIHVRALRIDAMGGHLTMDTESNIRLKPLGEAGFEVDYPRANLNFGGDCVYFLQRHFVDCMRSGEEFESNGEDYLKTLAVVDAVYESAAGERW